MTDRNLLSLDLALMGLLWQQPRSGYDLLKVFAETAIGGFSSSPGAVYPALKRLERAGRIRGTIESRTTLRPRRVYRLTAAGTAALKQELRRSVTHDDVVRDADGVLLRFGFAGEVLGGKEAIRILEQYADEIAAYLPELKAQLAALPREAGPYGAYALQHGIDMYAADARWARKVIQDLKQRKPGNTSPARRRSRDIKRGGRR
jgi:DNA-binding PadR family transcriptional regulator